MYVVTQKNKWWMNKTVILHFFLSLSVTFDTIFSCHVSINRSCLRDQISSMNVWLSYMFIFCEWRSAIYEWHYLSTIFKENFPFLLNTNLFSFLCFSTRMVSEHLYCSIIALQYFRTIEVISNKVMYKICVLSLRWDLLSSIITKIGFVPLSCKIDNKFIMFRIVYFYILCTVLIYVKAKQNRNHVANRCGPWAEIVVLK